MCQKATSPTKAGELIEDQFASVARQALWLCNIAKRDDGHKDYLFERCEE
jgi:hypothetical protein